MLDLLVRRRNSPRIGVEALAWECVDGRETSALAVDISSVGLCLERPFVPGMPRGAAPLQLEVPGIDEILWAKGEPCFDQVVPRAPSVGGGPFGLIRRTGYRIVVAARRDLRMLSEFVFETHRLKMAEEAMMAS